MFGIGWMELVLILIIVLVIFGAGRLPEIGSGFGKAIKNFKKSIKDVEDTPTEQDKAKLEEGEK
ncbi:MAG: twin-arginine translocase TatA/TatE family subunit [Pseudomonadota bacterium]